MLNPKSPRGFHAKEKFRVEAESDPSEYTDQIVAGDIIAFHATEASSDGSLMMGAALGTYTHIAIAIPSHDGASRLLTADSGRGVIIESVRMAIQNRDFIVFHFPAAFLNVKRLKVFANRAALLGRLDYDYSAAFFGMNSNITPNHVKEIGEEYTCASVVAAALHYGGISLDRACCPYQYVSPGDIIFSRALRNTNYRGKPLP